MRRDFLACSLTGWLGVGFLVPSGGEAEECGPHAAALSRSDEEALRLGRKVLAAKAAILNPAGPNAMRAIMDLGTDSRYYMMVRGWLVMRLQADRSVIAAAGDDARSEMRERVAFLEQAIRAIDLE